jgi:hypothetical protein
MKKCRMWLGRIDRKMYVLALVVAGVLATTLARAQAADGNAGITQATSQIAGYFDIGCNLMYAIGAVVGIIGAVKVFLKWNHGDHDTTKVATAWFGSCIFLVIVATILKAFFGVS